jgi:hypothetical protein
MAIDTSVENFSGAVLKALAVSTSKFRPRHDPRPSIPANIQDEIRLKDRIRRTWQITGDPALKAEINRLHRCCKPKANRLEERPVECYTQIRPSRRPVALENDQTRDESSYSITPVHRRCTALSESPKAEALADSMENQFQPLTVPSAPAVI